MHHDDILMKYSVLALQCSGLFPMKFKEPVKQISHTIFHYTCWTCFVTFVATQYIDLFQKLVDRVETAVLIDNLCITLLNATTMAKVAVCLCQTGRKLLQEIRDTERAILSGDDDTVKDIFNEHLQTVYKLTFIIFSAGPLTAGIYMANPYMQFMFEKYKDENATFQYNLPYHSWFPFDVKEHYHVAYVVQLFAGTHAGCLACISDAHLWGIMVFGIAQIKILQYKLRSIRAHSKLLMADGRMSQYTAEKMAMRKCVVLHKMIISFVIRLDSRMNWVMILDFVICSMQMGACAVRIFWPGSPTTTIISGMEFLSATIFQMMMFYWYANEITVESLGVAEAIYDSSWYECSEDIKKSMLFMMVRSQVPLTLNIGPFTAMSTSAAISILKATYSYATLIIQTADK